MPERYDYALREWSYSGRVGPNKDFLYTDGESYLLGKYLFTAGELLEIILEEPHFIVDTEVNEVMGKIVDIDFLRSLWILEIDGEIEILPGKLKYKPVKYVP